MMEQPMKARLLADILALHAYLESGTLDPRLSFEHLRETLGNPLEPVQVRTQAMFALWRIGHPQAEAVLIAATHDPDKAIRAAAIRDVARCTDPLSPLSIASILEALRDPAWQVREAAASAATGLPREVVVIPLLTLLHDPLHEVRWDAAHSLGRIGDPRALPTLSEVATRDTSPSVRQAATEACQAIGAST